MDISKDILDRIGQHESELLEYKAVLPPAATVAQLICAFANTKGGAIVLGVVDDGKDCHHQRAQRRIPRGTDHAQGN
jgi:predicted HTH transcriptional regulator